MARVVRLFAVLVLLGAALAALPAVTGEHVALADDVTIDNTCDETEFNAALVTAHMNGGGTITSDCAADTTITFTSEKEITADITIDSVNEITFDGGDANRHFLVTSDGDLTLENINVENGNAGSVAFGGAIFNNGGTLTVTDSTFSGNSSGFDGGAIFNDSGTLTVTNSTFSSNSADSGGAIRNLGGTLTVTNATFSGNSADFGGAIYNTGTASITDSTFSNHVDAQNGGAINNNSGGTLEVVNSTFFKNASEFGGAIINSETADIANSTFFGNSATASGGALDNLFGTATVTASILVESTLNNCAGDPSISGGYNLTDDTSCNFTNTGDIQNGDANLGSLADNGGPTQTMLPVAPSDAIDAIPNAFCSANLPATDQRGVARPQLSGYDIGAVEITVDEVPDHSLCANRYNGDLRMPRTQRCASTEVLLTLPDDGPINVCVNRYNGDARYSRAGRCASTEFLIEVVGDFSQPVCVNRYNGELRVPRRAGQCASTEVARLI